MASDRTTTRASPTLSGVGLFSGTAASVTFRPGERGSGVVFERRDVAGKPRIGAVISRVTTDPAHTRIPGAISGRNTTIVSEDGRAGVATVEHVMSALAGLGVTDVVVEVDGPEVPILDGSSEPFVKAIEAAGLEVAGSITRAYRLADTIEIQDARTGGRIIARPRAREGTGYSYRIDYGPTAPECLQDETARWESGHDTLEKYEREVAPARTFCMQQEAVAMKSLGLFPNLSAREMLVIAPDGNAVENSFRFPSRPFEPARHKLLDLIGDIALAGFAIQAEIEAERSGHSLTHALVREVCARAAGA